MNEMAIDYRSYRLSTRERIIYSALGGVIAYAMGVVFYKSAWAFIFSGLGAIVFPKWRAHQLRDKRLKELTIQFKQALFSLSSSLSSGNSLERAVSLVTQDLITLYPSAGLYMIREFTAIEAQMKNGIPIEIAMSLFGKRAGVEEIIQFAEMLAICKRTGGNMVQVVRQTTDVIGDKVEIQQDIEVMIAQKRFEAKVMAVAPLLIIAILSISSPDYMQPLYSGIGPIVMSFVVLCLIACYWLMAKIMEFKI